MFEFDYRQTKDCNESMSRNEVVQVLQREFELLRDELKWRDKMIAENIAQLEKDVRQFEISDPSGQGLDRYRAELSAMGVMQAANEGVHERLREVTKAREGANA